jgi:CarboxypepD_reg-like domain/TonB dependent receptor-like, beta-barrel/TonB-dependent Receptor Plug Domain
MKRFTRLFIAAAIFSVMSHASPGTEGHPTGTLRGTIIDSESRQPLPGALVVLKGTHIGTSSDTTGKYELSNVAVGSYTVLFSSLGFEKLMKTDVIVTSDRTLFLNAELKPTDIAMEEVTVHSGYFSRIDAQPISAATFSAEEIRRQAGSAGDISRVLLNLPSMAKINDSRNSLIVRGGSPMENGFYLDNIEIPNINHYPVQGSSDGPIGLLNVEFIRDVNFSSGAFSPAYGDRLSSVMELAFREGNREKFEMQLDLSMQGVGSVVEGPLNGGKGSWFLSARRSYLDLIFRSIDFNGPIPAYGDLQGKVVFDLSEKHRLSFLTLTALDNISQTREEALANKNSLYEGYGLFNNTVGVNWQYLWSQTGYSEFSLAHTIMKSDGDVYESFTGLHLLDNRSNEQEYKLRNKNHIRFSPSHGIEIGVDAKYMYTTYEQKFSPYTDRLGNVTQGMVVDADIRTIKVGVFFQHTWKISDHLTFLPGARFDYFKLNGRGNVSPRVSLSYDFNPRTTLTASAGVFFQNLPLVLLSQEGEFRRLRDPRAYHYVLGLAHLLTENTRLTVEVYDKEYRNCPMDPSQAELFVLDEAVDAGILMNHERLIDVGRAFSRGIEVMVQKKLAEDIYGVVAGSYFRSRYQDLNGTWRDRLYDNKVTLTIEGGYKPNPAWEFSLRWLYAGGAPYTPFDEETSATLHRGVYDRSRINMNRFPDYHSMNVRVDRRFHFDTSTLIVYLSVWNIYGRENISHYAWNGIENKQEPEKMWGTFPVLGVEYEF